MPALTLAIPPKRTNSAGALNGFPPPPKTHTHTHTRKNQNQNLTPVKQGAGAWIQLNDINTPLREASHF